MKIVHVIDSLALGGTENQFLSLLPDLARDHEIVLVTLTDVERPNLGPLAVVRRYSFGFTGSRSLPRAVLKLRRIIRTERPDLVRAQLYWSSVAARLATPKSVPLIFSIHSILSVDGYDKHPASLWLEKMTYGRRHHLISVSQYALADFDAHVGLKGGADVLTNFLNPEFLGHRRGPRPFAPPFRLIAVGNLKSVKNYSVLIDALKQLPPDIRLDIYGEGTCRVELERQIAEAGANIRLMGVRDDIWNVLPDYDLFVMPSLYEGCPNAAIQAMATGLPLLLSDLPVMREVSHGNALFFDPHDPGSFVSLMERVRAGDFDLRGMADAGLDLIETDYLKAEYLKRLNAIYERVVASNREAGERRGP